MTAAGATRCSARAAARLPTLSLSGGRLASCLFLSSLWPEPDSSAAGVRTEALLHAFQRWGYDCSFAASSAPKSAYVERLQSRGVQAYECPPNREAELARVLERTAPDVVVFDRFFTEEAFSFRVRELAPAALRVLDMQDMHALRRGRQLVVEQTLEQGASSDAAIAAALAHTPSAGSSDLLRELAAVHRSDLTLVCSPVEQQLLAASYGIPSHKLALASFFCAEAAPDAQPGERGFGYGRANGFDARADFVTVGGFKHPPNVDAVRWLASDIWPRIRARMPQAQLRIYGAYPTAAVQRLHSPDTGLRVCGYAPSLDVLAASRVLLAPLRYGAGIKGKAGRRSWLGGRACEQRLFTPAAVNRLSTRGGTGSPS